MCCSKQKVNRPELSDKSADLSPTLCLYCQKTLYKNTELHGKCLKPFSKYRDSHEGINLNAADVLRHTLRT